MAALFVVGYIGPYRLGLFGLRAYLLLFRRAAVGAGCGMVVFMFFNIDFHFGWFEFLNPLQEYVWIAGNGAMQALLLLSVT